MTTFTRAERVARWIDDWRYNVPIPSRVLPFYVDAWRQRELIQTLRNERTCRREGHQPYQEDGEPPYCLRCYDRVGAEQATR